MLGATCCRGGALQLPVATSCGAASQRVLSAACAAPPAFYKMPCCTMCMLAAGSTSSFASERWLGEVRAASFSTNFACEPRGSRASEREHAAHMPLPCHEAPHESRGCRKLTMSLYVRASGEGGCAARFVCVLVRAVGSLRALYLTGLARRAAGCVHVGTAGALAPWCRHGALRSNARSETPRSVGATGEVLRS